MSDPRPHTAVMYLHQHPQEAPYDLRLITRSRIFLLSNHHAREPPCPNPRVSRNNQNSKQQHSNVQTTAFRARDNQLPAYPQTPLSTAGCRYVDCGYVDCGRVMAVGACHASSALGLTSRPSQSCCLLPSGCCRLPSGCCRLSTVAAAGCRAIRQRRITGIPG